MKAVALKYLRTALANPQGHFRHGQWESIEGLLAGQRILVVQRTGWGKSMVYFLATKLLRERGSGPTLLISPLLSLMRNQLEAASRIGIIAKNLDSTNREKWNQIQEELRDDSVDVLMISPERLANDFFRREILSIFVERIGLFVVDEAHCISDWGHDFRPDYKRIVRVLQAIPANVSVLATTATANDRVVDDIVSQMRDGLFLIRGPLVRKSLSLQNITMPSPVARMAWLAQTVPSLPGSGIIYVLTQRDAERLAEWLRVTNLAAKAYHAGLPSSERETLEQALLKNKLKVLVATVALGMGFDKPDLGFVVHFQRPASVIHYYQQVGRAGRAVDEAYGILLGGEEDHAIADYFIRSAFPPQAHVEKILEALGQAEDGLSVPSIESLVNLPKSQIDKTLCFLTVESPSPVAKVSSKWYATTTAAQYQIDQDYVNKITHTRRQEQNQMEEYLKHSECLMAFLEKALDDPNPQSCGKCMNCNPTGLLSGQFDEGWANRAAHFLKRSYLPIEPRKKWPAQNPMPEYGFSGTIGEALQASEGRALCLWRDDGWGQKVYIGKYEIDRFGDDLVDACIAMIAEWKPNPRPVWVTCIPSLKTSELVPDFASRLAKKLGLTFFSCIEKTKDNSPQKLMENSFQQTRNLDGVFQLKVESLLSSPCLLIDDIVDSRWTLTVASGLLRQAGCTAVYPLALALNSPRRD